MKLIDRNDIESWANRFDSKGNFPSLVSRLVRATTPTSTQVDFPSGSAAYTEGWDGIVNCQEDTGIVPKGVSLWEFGTEHDSKGKADDDYDKRTVDPLGYDISQSTYIFVTPRFWKLKEKWRLPKLADHKWKDVRVYDSRNIEQWLDTTPAVSRWFSSYIGKYPSDGIITIEEFWKEWALGPVGELPPSIITLGREFESRELLNFLTNPPNIKGIKATSKDEAIAFIIATAKQFEEHNKEMFFSKSLVIDNPANFRSVRINTRSLNLIVRFEEPQILFAAAAEGHHVLVALGPDDTFNQEIITLPSVSRDGQITSLVSIGLSEDDATRYSKEAGRNITILKRLLKFPQNKAKWINSGNVREIIPALLLGRWNENNIGDRKILERFSGMNYNEYAIILTKWRDLEESPLIQIGTTWRLTSPLDAWTNISPSLLKSDFEILKECFMFAFQDGNPQVEPNQDSAELSIFFNREKTFSTWGREGLIQSLILIGLYGEGLKIPNIPTPQLWVDYLIHSLLFKAQGLLWASLDHEMPLISEASPNSFFESIYESLAQEKPPIMEIFVEKNGFISPTSYHTGLLWALEGLAWMPEYLYNASLVFLKLSSLDPGGNLVNRPINSITEVFKPWHYQTLSTYEERMEILKKITDKEKEPGWTLLKRMLPDRHGVAHPTNKMRWRMFDKNFNLNYTYPEIWSTYSFVIDLMISIFDHSEIKFSQLIDASVILEPGDREKVLSFAEIEYSKVDQIDFTTWHIIRKILSHHRSYPYTDWALPEKDLLRYEELYNKLEPNDYLQKYVWLFNEDWPVFPKGFEYKDHDGELIQKHKQQEDIIENARVQGLKIILDQYGIEKVKAISNSIKDPWSFGDTLAKIIIDEDQTLSVIEVLNSEKSNLRFIHSFLLRKTILNGTNWVFLLYDKLKKIDFKNKTLAQLFVPQIQTEELWDFIDNTNDELKKEYWLSVSPRFYNLSKEGKIIGLNYLLHFNRFYSAIDICSHFSEEIPSLILVNILYKAATEESSEAIRISEYEITRLFETLDKRVDIEHETLIQLEWLYLSLLARYGTSRNPKMLHEELANSPKFFIDVLKLVYMPKDKNLIKIEQNNLSDEIIQNRAKQAYQLLHSWKMIPGVTNDGIINKEFLNAWIDTVRELAEKEDRLEVADMQIGQILAQYPEKDLNWPPDEICEIIERINTESLKSNFSTATFNKRGFSSRGPFDGGNIEKGHAEYFEKLSLKHRINYPNVASILDSLSKGYIESAKHMDERAERDRLEY
jgi:hypothetical protein